MEQSREEKARLVSQSARTVPLTVSLTRGRLRQRHLTQLISSHWVPHAALVQSCLSTIMSHATFIETGANSSMDATAALLEAQLQQLLSSIPSPPLHPFPSSILSPLRLLLRRVNDNEATISTDASSSLLRLHEQHPALLPSLVNTTVAALQAETSEDSEDGMQPEEQMTVVKGLLHLSLHLPQLLSSQLPAILSALSHHLSSPPAPSQAVLSCVSVAASSTPLSRLLPALSQVISSVDATSSADSSTFQLLRLIACSLPSPPSASSADAEDCREAVASFVSTLLPHLRIPQLYTDMDSLQLQRMPITASLQHQHAAYTSNAACILQAALTALSLSSFSLPSSLTAELLLCLLPHSFSIPAPVSYRFPATSLSLLQPAFTSPVNRELAVRVQGRLCELTTSARAGNEEQMLSVLYERWCVTLLRRLRRRMGGKDEEWKADVSSQYALCQLVSHLSASSPSTSALLSEHEHELVPLLLPLLNDYVQRSKHLGCLLLSHSLLVLPSHSLSGFSSLLSHTLATMLTDREPETVRIVLPTAVDLLMSTTAAFPLSAAQQEEQRLQRRQAFFSSFLSELHFLPLSPAAADPSSCPSSLQTHLEQLLRLLLFLHEDVLPSVSRLFPVLVSLLTSPVSVGIRHLGLLCFSLLLSIPACHMRRHAGKTAEALLMAQVESRRQAELEDRNVAFVSVEMQQAPFVLEMRQRAEGWRRTEAECRELMDKLCKRWKPELHEYEGWDPYATIEEETKESETEPEVSAEAETDDDAQKT